MRRLHAILIVTLLATTACKSTLTFHSGQRVAAKVESADRDFVYVVLDEPKADWEAYDRARYAQARLGPDGQRGEGERLYRVPREALRGVSPPGLALGVVGGVCLEIALGVLVTGFVEERGCGGVCDEFAYYAGIGGGIAVGGLATAITGWAIYGSTAARARPATPDASSDPSALTVSF